MDIQQGNHVLVNVAAFTGAKMRHRESVPCVVLAVDGSKVHVRTQEPYRTFCIWVPRAWIDRFEEPAPAC
jgi:hypothetical protein